MKTLFKNIKLADIVAGIFIILFTYTGVNKLVDYPTFRIAVVQSPLLEHFADVAVFAVPIAELIVVALLMFSATRRFGLWASLFLMAVFTIYVTYLMFFASERPCNCGGIMKALSWKQHLVVNIILTALAARALVSTRVSKRTVAVAKRSKQILYHL